MSSMDLATIRDRGTRMASTLTLSQKVLLGVVVLASGIGLYLFAGWASKPDYTTLFSNLAPEDASGITTELDSRGVSYELADGGSRVLVPQSDVYQLRIDLAAQGLPAGGTDGYKLLDEQGITTSQMMQRVNLQRALEGELARTIGSMDGVQNAAVHLVMPTQDLFSGDGVKPKASVTLTVGNASAVGSEQAQTIVNLVSSSVEGLDPADVTVNDTLGRTLSLGGAEGEMSGMSSTRFRQTEEWEADLVAEISAMLEPVTGAGKALVTVNGDLDFDDRSITTKRFDQPGTSPIAAEEEATEQFSGTDGSGTAGVLGEETLTDAAAGAGGAQTGSSSNTTRQYAVGEVTETVVQAPGGVRRLSVSVVVDETNENLDLAEIRQVVQGAVGFDTSRGDVVTVQEMTFDTAGVEAAEEAAADAEAAEKRAELVSWIRNGLIVAVVAVILFFVWRATRRALEGEAERESIQLTGGDALMLDGVGAQGVDGELALATMRSSLDQNPPNALPPRLNPDQLQRQQRSNEVSSLIDRQPEEVAALLRSWLADRRG